MPVSSSAVAESSASRVAPTPGRPRPPRVPRKLGAAAGLFALAVLVNALIGAVWGLLRPAYSGTVTADGAVLLDNAANIEFTSYITFAVITGLVGAIIAISAFFASPPTRGIAMLLWVGVVAVIGAVAFLSIGDLVALERHPVPEDPTALGEGDRLSSVPMFNPGVAWAAAPFTAVLAYWFCLLLTPEMDETTTPLTAVREAEAA